MKVTSPALARMLLEHIIERTEDDIDGVLFEGVDAELVDMLRHRPARDIIKLSLHPERLGLVFAFDKKAIIRGLMQIEAKGRDAAQFEYFLCNGASLDVIARLFHLPAETVRTQRALLLPPEAISVREKMPEARVRDEIHRKWAQLSDLPLRERLLALHQAFDGWSIDTLCRVLREFDEFANTVQWLDSEIGMLR